MNPMNYLVDAAQGKSHQPVHLNTEYSLHLNQLALQRGHGGPWVLRLLPRALRLKVQDYLTARRVEAQLIKLWETSPHLLRDAGVVLTRATDLPAHLLPAPKRVLEHVAAIDPEQIVEAELQFPPGKAIVVAKGKSGSVAVFGKVQSA